jgi:hypothetical protein
VSTGISTGVERGHKVLWTISKGEPSDKCLLDGRRSESCTSIREPEGSLSAGDGVLFGCPSLPPAVWLGA